MNKLDMYQRYADKCAEKLGITDKIVIRWATTDTCKLSKGTYAHCHVQDGKFPRGTICLSRKWFAKFSVKTWHHCMAHEVAHLAVKSAHRTPTFDRRMVTLGVANNSERLNARRARKGHHHIWMYGWLGKRGAFKECRVCHKRVFRAP